MQAKDNDCYVSVSSDSITYACSLKEILSIALAQSNLPVISWKSCSVCDSGGLGKPLRFLETNGITGVQWPLAKKTHSFNQSTLTIPSLYMY